MASASTEYVLPAFMEPKPVMMNACYHAEHVSESYGITPCTDAYCDCPCYTCTHERRIAARLVCGYCRIRPTVSSLAFHNLCEECWDRLNDECETCGGTCYCDNKVYEEQEHDEDEREHDDDEDDRYERYEEDDDYEETYMRCGCERTESGWSYCLNHHPSNNG